MLTTEHTYRARSTLCSEVLVELLLRLALIVLEVSYGRMISASIHIARPNERTRGLLRTVASDGADNRVLLALDTVHRALSIALSLGSLGLGLAGRVLLRARLLPGLEAGHVADLRDACQTATCGMR